MGKIARILLIAGTLLSCSKTKPEPIEQYQRWLASARKHPVDAAGEERDVHFFFPDPVKGGKKTHLHVIANGVREHDQWIEPELNIPHVEKWTVMLPIGRTMLRIWLWSEKLNMGWEYTMECDTSRGPYVIISTWSQADSSLEVLKEPPQFQ